MPSRFMCLAIVLCWLATSAWFAVRELRPAFREGEPPPYTIDLADEVGANTISWIIFKDHERVGNGLSRVRRLHDRTFELLSEFRFDQLKLFDLVDPRKLVSTYRITREGQLLSLESSFRFQLSPNRQEEVRIQGEVHDGQLAAHLLWNDQKVGETNPVAVPSKGQVLNPMHLVNKIAGLREGQQWTVPLIDPLSSGISGLPVLGRSLTELEATVSRETLIWNDHPTECFRIDYHAAEKKAKATTWVRRGDSLVLQQEAHYGSLMALKLVRDNR